MDTLAPRGWLNTWLFTAEGSAGAAEASNLTSCCTASGLVPVEMPAVWAT